MSDELPGGCIVVIIVAAIVFAIVWTIAAHSSVREVTCTVQHVDRVSDGNGGSDARIYTKECGVLENTDAWPFGKFDSADVQGQLKEGQVQTFEIAYWRIPFFSMFPDIIEVKN